MNKQFEIFLNKLIKINQGESKEPIEMLLKKETKTHVIGTKYPKKPLRFNRIKHPKNQILSASTLPKDNAVIT